MDNSCSNIQVLVSISIIALVFVTVVTMTREAVMMMSTFHRTSPNSLVSTFIVRMIVVMVMAMVMVMMIVVMMVIMIFLMFMISLQGFRKFRIR